MAWCDNCAPYGGRFRLVVKPNGAEGMERCDCPDSARVASLEARRKNPVAYPPVMTDEAALAMVLMLAGGLPFVPADGLSRSVIAMEIAAMCSSAEDAMWLVRQMIREWTDWKGVKAMRLLYCNSGRTPLDGLLEEEPPLEGECYLPAPEKVVPRRIGAGQVVPEIRQLAAGKDLAQVRPPRKRGRDEGRL